MIKGQMENTDIQGGKMLNFFLTSVIVGSGVIIGAILSIIAKDELKPGKKYFRFLKNILFSSVILIISSYYVYINPIISFFVIILLTVLLVEKFQLNLIYIAFGVAYMLSSVEDSLFILISSLIFFAGFPIGTAAAHDLTKKEIFVERKIFTSYFIFVFIAFIRTLFSIYYKI